VSFEEFVAARLPALLRYAVVLTGDRHLAEDLVQDVLISAHRRWKRIAATDRPDQYVFRMVTNAYLSWRRRWSTRTILLVEPPERAADEQADRPDQSELWLRLARLPRQQRAALVLRYYEGLSVAETADVLGCAPATVRSNTSRALAALRVEPTFAYDQGEHR
jgi:RNA polymerase sigma-70 factor (sigma-E family)